MKKDLLIAGLVVLVLISGIALFSFFKNNNQSNYKLPFGSKNEETTGKYLPQGSPTAQIREIPELSVFNELVTLSGFGKSTTNSRSYTIFAPSNEAFAKLTPERLVEIKSNPELRRQVVFAHIFLGSIPQAKLALINGTYSLQHTLLTVSEDNKIVNNANITNADIVSGTHYLHIIDNVFESTSTPVTQ